MKPILLSIFFLLIYLNLHSNIIQDKFSKNTDYIFENLEKAKFSKVRVNVIEILKTPNSQISTKEKGKLLLTICDKFEERELYTEVLFYVNLAEKQFYKNNEMDNLALCYSTKGRIFGKQGNKLKSYSYFKKSLDLYKKNNNLNGVAAQLNNIAISERINWNLEKSNKYLFNALEINIRLGLHEQIGHNYSNLGKNMLLIQKYKESEIYFKKAINEAEFTGLIEDKILYKINLADLYVVSKRPLEAKNILKSIQSKCIDINKLEYLSLFYANLSKAYSELNKMDSAFYYSVEYIKNNERISEKSRIKEQTNIELKHIYDLEKIKFQNKIQSINTINDTRIRISIILTFSIIILLIISVFFAIKMRKRLKLIKYKNEIIAEKNKILEKKNKDIKDSINYAQNIQQAILPKKEELNSFFSSAIVFYEPKDIVAGDFYWVFEKDNWKYFAVADCTGHGVPGALMSSICFSALNRAVYQENIFYPNEILELTRELLIKQWKRPNIKDGMDIALCGINHIESKLYFSGANNNCWILNKHQLTEWKGNRQPIGLHIHCEKFNLFETKYDSETLVYLSTDGLADQFGGPKSKKLKTQKIKELITTFDNVSENEFNKIQNLYKDWKKGHEQIDDICVLGIKP